VAGGFAAQGRCIFGKLLDKKSPAHSGYVISTLGRVLHLEPAGKKE
jgi:hypothetical protein